VAAGPPGTVSQTQAGTTSLYWGGNTPPAVLPAAMSAALLARFPVISALSLLIKVLLCSKNTAAPESAKGAKGCVKQPICGLYPFILAFPTGKITGIDLGTIKSLNVR